MAVSLRAASTKGFGAAYPISAPSGLADGDVVYLWIETAADSNARTLSGFSVLRTGNRAGTYVHLLRGEISGTPPSGFSPTNGVSGDNTLCVALYDQDLTNEVVGTLMNEAGDGADQEIPGVTIADDDSYLLAFVASNGNTNPAVEALSSIVVVGYATLRGDPVDAGATGSQTLDTTSDNPWSNYHFGVLVGVPPASAGGTDATATPGAIAAAVALPSSSTQAGSTFTPDDIQVSALLHSPTASGSISDTASPQVQSLSVGMAAPDAQAGATAGPDVAQAVVAVHTPTVDAGVSGTSSPDVIPIVTSAPPTTQEAGATTQPGVIDVLIDLLVPSVSGTSADTATPDVIATSASVLSADPSAGSSVSPGQIDTLIAMLAPAASVGAIAAPDVIQAVTGAPAVSISAGVTVAPSSVVAAVTMHVAAASGTASGTASPDAILGIFDLGAVDVSIGAAADVGLIATSILLQAVQAQAGSTVDPDDVVVTITTHDPLAVAAIDQTVNVGVIEAVATLYVPTIETAVSVGVVIAATFSARDHEVFSYRESSPWNNGRYFQGV